MRYLLDMACKAWQSSCILLSAKFFYTLHNKDTLHLLKVQSKFHTTCIATVQYYWSSSISILHYIVIVQYYWSSFTPYKECTKSAPINKIPSDMNPKWRVDSIILDLSQWHKMLSQVVIAVYCLNYYWSITHFIFFWYDM